MLIKDLEDWVLLTDYQQHSFLLEVFSVHLQVIDDILEEDTLATVSRDKFFHLNMHEMHMKMEVGRVVVEHGFNL